MKKFLLAMFCVVPLSASAPMPIKRQDAQSKKYSKEEMLACKEEMVKSATPSPTTAWLKTYLLSAGLSHLLKSSK